MDLFDLAEAVAARDAAIASVAQHANEAVPDWTEQAYRWICLYAEAHPEFISEHCTAAAHAAGIPVPHDSRAWGQPFKRAAHDLIIVKAGYGISNRRHRSPTPLWKSMHANHRRQS